MKVTEHIRDLKKTIFTFEVLPPLKGESIHALYRMLDPLMEFKPPFINVTYHRSEYVYKKLPNGYLQKVAVRKRPGTVGICAAIMNRYKVDTVPHIICGGFTREETEDALLDLHYIGIENVLALRGDPPRNEKDFKPEEGGHGYAVDLVKQIININQGKYMEEDLKNGIRTNFCVGVAGYPEKHFESPNLEEDLHWVKAKADAGAEFIVTQMFYDNKNYFQFVENCRKTGITIPIIPGLKPIVSKKQIKALPKTFNIDIPFELSQELEKCSNEEQACEVGKEWLFHQTKELIAAGIPCVHFFTMSNDAASLAEVVKKVF
jgi:methylenetetrahydrofolate reductase (NADPH)